MSGMLQSLFPGSQSPTSGPLLAWSTLDLRSQTALREIASLFESIDELVLGILKHPPDLGESGHSREKQNVADSAASLSELAGEFEALGILEHGDNDVMAYLGDRKFVRYWQRAFNHIAIVFSKGSSYSPDGQATQCFFELAQSSNALALLVPDVVVLRHDFTHVINGIESRCNVIEAMLDTGEHIHERSLLGMSSANHTPVLKSLYSKRSRIDFESKTFELSKGGYVSRVISDKTIIGVTSVVALTATALQIASFMASQPWNTKNFSQADLLNFLQSLFVQLLALFIMLVPVVHDKSLHQPWVFIFATISFVCAILAPALYASVGPAWSNLLSYFAVISQALLTLQLIQGLQNSVLKAQKAA